MDSKSIGSSLNLIRRGTLAGKLHKKSSFYQNDLVDLNKVSPSSTSQPCARPLTGRILPNLETRARSEVRIYRNESDSFGRQFEKSVTKEGAHLCSSQTYLERVFFLIIAMNMTAIIFDQMKYGTSYSTLQPVLWLGNAHPQAPWCWSHSQPEPLRDRLPLPKSNRGAKICVSHQTQISEHR